MVHTPDVPATRHSAASPNERRMDLAADRTQKPSACPAVRLSNAQIECAGLTPLPQPAGHSPRRCHFRNAICTNIQHMLAARSRSVNASFTSTSHLNP